MVPAIAASLIAAGGQAFNAASTGLQNRANRKFALEQYSRQRSDAITDWNMQNQYNSPAAQMERYKAAGLNPNLIYGQTNQAAPVRSVNADTPRGNAAQFDAGSVLGAYYDTQLKGQQTDNLKTAQEVAKMDIELKKAQIIATLANGGLLSEKRLGQALDNYVKNELLDTTLETAKVGLHQKYATLENTWQQTSFSKNQDMRADKQLKVNQQLAANTLANGVEDRLTKRLGRELTRLEMEKMYVMINNLIKDGQMKDFELSLNQAGTTKSDNAVSRQIIRVGDIIGENLGKPIEWFKDWLNKARKYQKK